MCLNSDDKPPRVLPKSSLNQPLLQKCISLISKDSDGNSLAQSCLCVSSGLKENIESSRFSHMQKQQQDAALIRVQEQPQEIPTFEQLVRLINVGRCSLWAGWGSESQEKRLGRNPVSNGLVILGYLCLATIAMIAYKHFP